MIIMLSQVPYRSFVVSSGNVYVADQYGVIENVVSVDDQGDLATAGCATLAPNPSDLLGYLIGANFNVTTDQLIINLNSAVKYRVTKITVCNASLSLTTAVGGLYNAASKAGTALVANTQVFSGLTAANKAIDLTLNNAGVTLAAATPIYLSLTTAQGAAATADVYIFGNALPTS